MERMKKPAVILGILGCISAIISIIGCVMLGINKEVIFLLLAIALFIVTAYLKNDILVYISYGFYLLTLYFLAMLFADAMISSSKFLFSRSVPFLSI